MLGKCRLAQTYLFSQIADAHLPLRNDPHDLEALAIRECGEKLRMVFKRVFGNHVIFPDETQLMKTYLILHFCKEKRSGQSRLQNFADFPADITPGQKRAGTSAG